MAITHNKRRTGLDAPQRANAFTLIEVIGVLALIAIAAALVLPMLVRQIDKSVSDQEIATLQSFGNALPQSIMRTRDIPGPADWMTNIAAELGMNVSDVKTNARNNARFMLIDPNLRIGDTNSGLPYTQSNWWFGSRCSNSVGTVVAPYTPRVMILSSLGIPFPNTLSSGVPSTPSDFTNIWNWDDTSAAVPATTALATWTGKAEDLKVQRINLSPIFVDLVLSTYASAANGFYSMDCASTNPAPYTNGIEGFFIQNTLLGLFRSSSPATLDSQQVLVHDASFVFESGIWKGSIVGGYMPGGFDLAGAVAQFLVAPTNSNAAFTDQPYRIVRDMTNYMGAYNAWATAGYPSAQKPLLISIQGTLTNDIEGIYNGIAGAPTNSAPCL